MTQRYGATQDEWFFWESIKGACEDLLPVVCNPGAVPSERSKIKSTGKLPSRYNNQGHVAGIKEWTSYQATTRDAARWANEPDYGICLQTRRFRAIDIDIDDPTLAKPVELFVNEWLTKACGIPSPVRSRSNSGKCLLLVEVYGTLSKAVVKTYGGMVEFLGNGQQCVVAGTHPSGVRYEWSSTDYAPALTLERYGELIRAVADEFGTELLTNNKAERRKLEDITTDDLDAQQLIAAGMVIGEAPGKLFLECPWRDQHTMQGGESETSWFLAGSHGYERGAFKCLHAHCVHRNANDLLAWLDFAEVTDEQVHAAERRDATVGRKYAPIERSRIVAMPDVDWLIDGVVPKQGVAMLYGEPSAGKSFAMLDLALTVTRGVPWLGRDSVRAKVGYVAAESAATFKARLMAYEKRHETPVGDDQFLLYPMALPLMNRPQVDRFIKEAQRYDAPLGLLVIDTLAQCMIGGNENDSKDMSLAIANVQHLSVALNTVVMLVHHSGKDSSKGARGWSGLRGAVDIELFVERERDSTMRRIDMRKNKSDDRPFRTWFELEPVVLGQRANGQELRSAVIVERAGGFGDDHHVEGEHQTVALAEAETTSPTMRDVMGLLSTHHADGVEWLDRQAIYRELVTGDRGKRTNFSVTSRAVNRLVADGTVTVSDDGKQIRLTT